MRRTRVFTDQGLGPEREVVVGKSAAHYLGRVLRLANGDSVVLFNGDGIDYLATIDAIQKNQVRLSVQDQCTAAAESPLRISMGLAVSRGERMDYSLQKSTELGVCRFQPLTSERVEVKLSGSRLDKRMAHWRGVIISACEQSGRAKLPELLPLLSLDQWLQQSAAVPRLVLQPGVDNSLCQLIPAPKSLELIIGPEGGFTKQELAHMSDKGVTAAHLGPRILRSETAAPAAVALLQGLYGDLS